MTVVMDLPTVQGDPKTRPLEKNLSLTDQQRLLLAPVLMDKPFFRFLWESATVASAGFTEKESIPEVSRSHVATMLEGYCPDESYAPCLWKDNCLFEWVCREGRSMDIDATVPPVPENYVSHRWIGQSFLFEQEYGQWKQYLYKKQLARQDDQVGY
jgi:hypothetical protein